MSIEEKRTNLAAMSTILLYIDLQDTKIGIHKRSEYFRVFGKAEELKHKIEILEKSKLRLASRYTKLKNTL